MTVAAIFSVLIMGFLGSWHCGVMCGPISCNFKKQKDFFSYHIGRLISYLVIGLIFYHGAHFFLDTGSRHLKMAASLFFGIILVYFGLNQWGTFKSQSSGKMNKFSKLHFHILKKFSPAQKIPLLMGLLTGLFPCAWLYSFLLLSSQMPSFYECLLVIAVFWLSSLPAFAILTGFMRHLIQRSPFSYQKISGFVLIAAGLFSIIGHWAEIIIRNVL